MSETLKSYVINKIKKTCYKYKYYLINCEISKDIISIKIATKQKFSYFRRIIEKEYPTEDIEYLLPSYLERLIFHMRLVEKGNEDMIDTLTSEEYDILVKTLNIK